VLRTRGLGKDYGEQTALASLDLEVRRGQVVALLGHNGAGKTTAVRLITGVLRPDRGELRVFGLDPARDGDEVRRRTGVATERPSLDPRLSARAALRLFAGLYGLPRSAEDGRIDAVLERFGLGDRADDRVGDYSKGMRQRLALARCALHEPDLYVLDEPSAGLDPLAARELRRWIADLAGEEGRSVLLCTHDLAEAQRLADRVVVLREGRIAAEGTPGELAERYGAARLTIDVAAEDADAARATLAAAEIETVDAGPDDLGTTPPGTLRLHLKAVGRRQAPDVARRLVEAGVRLERLEPADASLEDVYVAVYGVTDVPAEVPA
jgi:ABC-type multidrug transport system ATPase subunit